MQEEKRKKKNKRKKNKKEMKRRIHHPATQLLHPVAPVLAWNLPAEHDVQLEPDEAAYEVAAHDKQNVNPDTAVTVPARQLVQVSAPELAW